MSVSDPVTFNEAREHDETQLRRVEACLAKSVQLGHVAEHELAELTCISDAYQSRLGGQPDPWTDFREHQSPLLQQAMEQYGTEIGVRAYAAYLANEAFPRPVSEADSV